METTKLAVRQQANVLSTYQSVQLGDADVLGVYHCVLLPRHQVKSQLSRKQIANIWEKSHLYGMY